MISLGLIATIAEKLASTTRIGKLYNSEKFVIINLKIFFFFRFAARLFENFQTAGYFLLLAGLFVLIQKYS